MATEPFAAAAGVLAASACALAAAASAFSFALDFLLVTVPYLLMNFSTRPSVSTNFWLPVKNGWQAEQISTCSFSRVEPVVNVLPHEQVTVATNHLGWIFSFNDASYSAARLELPRLLSRSRRVRHGTLYHSGFSRV